MCCSPWQKKTLRGYVGGGRNSALSVFVVGGQRGKTTSPHVHHAELKRDLLCASLSGVICMVKVSFGQSAASTRSTANQSRD